MDWIWTVGGAAVGGVGAVLVVPVIVAAVGFGPAGIVTGSVAALLMSISAITSGGGVIAGGIVATLQTIGATGALSGVVAAGVGAVGAIVGAVVGGN